MRVTSIAILVVLLLVPSSLPAAAPTSAPASTGRSLKALREEEKTVDQLLAEVNNRLDQLSAAQTKSFDTRGMSHQARDRRLGALRELQEKYEGKLAHADASLKAEGDRTHIAAAEIELGDRLEEQFEAQRDAGKLTDALEQRKGESGKAVKDLEAQRDQANARLEKLKSQVATATKNLAQVTNEPRDQSVLLDSQKHARSRLREIEREIDELELAAKTEGDPETARDEQQNQTQEQAVQLNNLKTKYQFALRNLRDDIRKTESSVIAAIFPDKVDVFLSAGELENNKPSIENAQYDGAYEFNSRTFVRLKSDKATWAFDPTKVIAVRSHP